MHSTQILVRWQDGHSGALGDLLRREMPRLERRLRSDLDGILSASASFSDLTQETFQRLIEKKEEVRFESPPAFRGWLRRCAERLAIDRWRRSRRKQELEDYELASEPEPEPDGADPLDEQLVDAMRLLNWNDRYALELTYVHGHDTNGLAHELGVSRAAAKMRLSRARAKLRALVGADVG